MFPRTSQLTVKVSVDSKCKCNVSFSNMFKNLSFFLCNYGLIAAFLKGNRQFIYSSTYAHTRVYPNSVHWLIPPQYRDRPSPTSTPGILLHNKTSTARKNLKAASESSIENHSPLQPIPCPDAHCLLADRYGNQRLLYSIHPSNHALVSLRLV